jgi:hypothetical protein
MDNAVALNGCHECRARLGQENEITYFYIMKHRV